MCFIPARGRSGFWLLRISTLPLPLPPPVSLCDMICMLTRRTAAAPPSQHSSSPSATSKNHCKPSPTNSHTPVPIRSRTRRTRTRSSSTRRGYSSSCPIWARISSGSTPSMKPLANCELAPRFLLRQVVGRDMAFSGLASLARRARRCCIRLASWAGT